MAKNRIGTIFSVGCLIAVWRRQRGRHSRVHHTLAGAAMATSLQMALAGAMGWRRQYVSLLGMLGAWIVAVFVTDGDDGLTWSQRLLFSKTRKEQDNVGIEARARFVHPD